MKKLTVTARGCRQIRLYGVGTDGEMNIRSDRASLIAGSRSEAILIFRT
jgi:hypothetical protein